MTDPRAAIGDALKGSLTDEQISKLVDEVLASTKKVRAEFNCKNCGKRQVQYGEMPDTKAVVDSLEKLLNQSFGRPTEESGDKAGVTFIRKVYAPDGAMMGTGWGEDRDGG